MEKGGIAKRILDLATALVGWITGSLYLAGHILEFNRTIVK